jgi:hypothetical protein
MRCQFPRIRGVWVDLAACSHYQDFRHCCSFVAGLALALRSLTETGFRSCPSGRAPCRAGLPSALGAASEEAGRIRKSWSFWGGTPAAAAGDAATSCAAAWRASRWPARSSDSIRVRDDRRLARQVHDLLVQVCRCRGGTGGHLARWALRLRKSCPMRARPSEKNRSCVAPELGLLRYLPGVRGHAGKNTRSGAFGSFSNSAPTRG